MENVLLPLFPLNEQRRIVGILNQVAKIEQLHIQAAKASGRLRGSLMARLLQNDI